MPEPVLVLTDARMLDHGNVPAHPERPERLRSVMAAVDALEGSGPELIRRTPTPATREQVEAVHDAAYVDRIDGLRGRQAVLDYDTGVTPGSVDAAYLAAGAVVDMVGALASGEARRGFALVRPPGHHAEAARAMGFCLFGNIAIGAAFALTRPGIERVMIVDWDVHHGNGTQRMFESRPDVFVFGSHRWPDFYPGTGRPDEIGVGPGTGCTVNIALPVGAGDDVVVPLYETRLPEAAASFRPDLVLVSAGFDAHADDPLGGLTMTDDGFEALCRIVVGVAEEHAQGRVGLVLEGGYDVDVLGRCVVGCLRVLGADP
jgi:acetoin utilization deacetylase AcuC-like enzyme